MKFESVWAIRYHLKAVSPVSFNLVTNMIQSHGSTGVLLKISSPIIIYFFDFVTSDHGGAGGQTEAERFFIGDQLRRRLTFLWITKKIR